MYKTTIHHSILGWLLLGVNTVGVLLLLVLAADQWSMPLAVAAPVGQVLAEKTADVSRPPMVATTTYATIREDGNSFVAIKNDSDAEVWKFVLPDGLKVGWADPIISEDIFLIPTFNDTFGTGCAQSSCASWEERASIPSYVYALNARTGVLLWKVQTDGRAPVQLFEVVDKRVYVGTEDNDTYKLRVIDLYTGFLQWKHTFAN